MRSLILLMAALFWSTPVLADSTVQVGQAIDGLTATTGFTWGSNTTSGNVIACYVWFSDSTTTVTSLTDSAAGALIDAGPGIQRLNSAHSAQMFYKENITGGTTPTMTLVLSAGTMNTIAVACVEISGRATSGALDQVLFNPQNFTGTGTDFVTSTSVTTTTAGQYIFGATHAQFGTDPTAGTNFTLKSSGTQHVYLETLTAGDQVAAGSIAATYTNCTPGCNDGWLTGIMTFKAAGPGSVQGCYLMENGTDFYLMENGTDMYALEGGDGGLCGGGSPPPSAFPVNKRRKIEQMLMEEM